MHQIFFAQASPKRRARRHDVDLSGDDAVKVCSQLSRAKNFGYSPGLLAAIRSQNLRSIVQ